MTQVAKLTRNVATLKKAYEAFNRNDVDAIRQHCAEELTYAVHARGIVHRGPDEFIEQRMRWLRGSYSDGRVEEATFIDAGDTVVATGRFRGTNDGPIDELPATGKKIDLPFCEVIRFNEEGQMASGEVFFDLMTMLTQLGHIQEPTDA